MAKFEQSFQDIQAWELNNNNINPELKKFLDDKIISSEEAQVLLQIYENNKLWIINVWKEELKDLRETISSSSNVPFLSKTDRSRLQDISSSNITNPIVESKTVEVKKEITISDIKTKLLDLKDKIKTPSDLGKELSKKELRILQKWWESEWIYKYRIDWLTGKWSLKTFNILVGNNEIKEKGVNLKIKIDNKEVKEAYSEESVLNKLEENKNNIRSPRDLGELLSRSELKILQIMGERKWYYKWRIDGLTWRKTFYAYEKLLGISNLNWKLESESQYRERFSWLALKLEQSLWIPKWIINAIIKKETTYWRNLNSSTWSKWIMQLTKWPFNDMSWDTEWGRKSISKVKSYLKIFQKLDINSMKNLSVGGGKTINETLPDDVWNNLAKLQDKNIKPYDAIKVIDSFRNIVKSRSNRHIYLHTLNMIIWSVYYTKLYNASWNSLKNASINYNGDNKTYGKKHAYKYNYWRTVMNYYNQEKNK